MSHGFHYTAIFPVPGLVISQFRLSLEMLDPPSPFKKPKERRQNKTKEDTKKQQITWYFSRRSAIEVKKTSSSNKFI